MKSFVLLQYYQAAKPRAKQGDEFHDWLHDEEDDDANQQAEKNYFPNLDGVFPVRRRLNPEKYAICRMRFVQPWGDDLEEYCFQRLVCHMPLRQEQIDALLAEHKTFFDAIINLGIVDKSKDAKQFLGAAAKRGYRTDRIMEMAQQFLDNGWLGNAEMDGLLETVAPGHQEIEKAVEEMFADDEDAGPEGLGPPKYDGLISLVMEHALMVLCVADMSQLKSFKAISPTASSEPFSG